MLFTPVLTGRYFELMDYIVFAVALCRLDVRITCGDRPPSDEMSDKAAHVLIYLRCYDPAIHTTGNAPDNIQAPFFGFVNLSCMNLQVIATLKPAPLKRDYHKRPHGG